VPGSALESVTSSAVSSLVSLVLGPVVGSVPGVPPAADSGSLLALGAVVSLVVGAAVLFVVGRAVSSGCGLALLEALLFVVCAPVALVVGASDVGCEDVVLSLEAVAVESVT
jgi:hypothetical protein